MFGRVIAKGDDKKGKVTANGVPFLTFTKRPLPPIAILLQLHARGARPVADLALVDDVARADDGFRLRAGVLGVSFVGLDGLHAQVECALHLLHGVWDIEGGGGVL